MTNRMLRRTLGARALALFLCLGLLNACESVLGLQPSPGGADATCEPAGTVALPAPDAGPSISSQGTSAGGSSTATTSVATGTTSAATSTSASCLAAISCGVPGGPIADASDESDSPAATPEAGALANGLPPPLAYWPLDRRDYSPPRVILARVGGFNGLFAGPSRQIGAIGKIGEAVQFVDDDQPSDGVLIPPTADDPLELTSAGTLSAWVYIDKLPQAQAHNMMILDKSGVTTDLALEVYYDDPCALGSTGPDDNNKIHFYVANQLLGASLQQLMIQTWYHVVGTFQADGPGCLYVNGQAQNVPCTTFSGLRPTDVQPLKFGDGAYFTRRGLSGRLDEIAIWNTALTAEQVATLYALGSTGQPLVPTP